jgi:large subunit ribosomal protein L13
MKTFSAKAQDVQRKWWVIDAEGKVLGRVAVEAARLLRGKHKPIFTPHVDTGDFVVVINAEKAVLTGNKETMKRYVRYTGWVGGQKIENARTLRARRPERMMESAVKGMVPHNRLGRQVMKKLKIYAGDNHPHEAQSPEAYAVS